MFILKWRFLCRCRSSFHLLPSKSETILNKTLRINLVVLLATMTLFFFCLSKISCFHILAFSISPLFWEGQADGDGKVSVLYVSRLDLPSLSLFITTEARLVTWPPAMQRKGSLDSRMKIWVSFRDNNQPTSLRRKCLSFISCQIQ